MRIRMAHKQAHVTGSDCLSKKCIWYMVRMPKMTLQGF